MTYHLAVVSAGIGQPSSTRLLADRLADAVVRRTASHGSDVLVEVVELRPLARALADHLVTGFPSPELEAALRTVTRADALVAVTPIFSASYSGLFKTFFDVLERDELAGMPTLVGATAGTARHSLALEHAVRPLFGYLRAVVVPTAVFAATEDFGDTADGRLADRIDRAAGELAALLAGGTQVHDVSGPGRSASGEADEDLAGLVPFEQLLGRGQLDQGPAHPPPGGHGQR